MLTGTDGKESIGVALECSGPGVIPSYPDRRAKTVNHINQRLLGNGLGDGVRTSADSEVEWGHRLDRRPPQRLRLPQGPAQKQRRMENNNQR
jgi:hypothetical protein